MKKLIKSEAFKITSLLSGAMLMLSANANADLLLNCSVGKVVIQADPQSPVVGLQLLCTPTAESNAAGMGANQNSANIWAPQSEAIFLSKLKTSGARADFTLTQFFGGTLTQINGRNVAVSDPNPMEENSGVVIAERNTASYQVTALVLDHQNVAFKDRMACNRRTGECRLVQDRSIRLELSSGNLRELTISQQGGGFSYGNWSDPYARIVAYGMADGGQSGRTTLSAETSARVRALFNFGSRVSFDYPASPDTHRFEGTRITLTDDGRIVRIFNEKL
ncbi:MAG: hypothetical protein H7333_03040 [Bdellovibrionales bacterium]|nr:hypothetical protein [Oligoflexia bacterium]